MSGGHNVWPRMPAGKRERVGGQVSSGHLGSGTNARSGPHVTRPLEVQLRVCPHNIFSRSQSVPPLRTWGLREPEHCIQPLDRGKGGAGHEQ